MVGSVRRMWMKLGKEVKAKMNKNVAFLCEKIDKDKFKEKGNVKMSKET